MSGTGIRIPSLAVKEQATKTIDTGVLTVDQMYIVVAAEAGVADDVDTITADFTTLSVNGTDYRPIICLIADAGDTITLKHGTAGADNLDLPSDTDITLTEDRPVWLQWNGTYWNTSRSDAATVNEFADDVFRVYDDGDNTKKLAFQVSGVTAANTRTVTIVDEDGTMTLIDATQTLTNKTLTTPAIGDFTNAGHDHADAAGGGQIDPATALSAAVAIAQGGTGEAAKQPAFDALSPCTTAGDTIYRNATDNVRLAIGTAAQLLKTNAGATAPEWVDPVFSDATFRVQDDGDPTKQIAFQASGITAANTRVVTVPDSDGTLRYTTDVVAIAQGGTGQAAQTAAFDALSPLTTQGDIIYHDGADNVRLAKGAATEVLTMNAGATAPEWAAAAGGGGLFESYAKLWDQKAQGTAGGAFTLGAWRTRDLNQETDPDGIVTLGTNDFDLAIGVYWIQARAPAYRVDAHQLRLQNTDDTVTELLGSAALAAYTYAKQTHAFLSGLLTVSGGTKTFELQHRSAGTQATNGFGFLCNFAVETYAEIEIFKLA